MSKCIFQFNNCCCVKKYGFCVCMCMCVGCGIFVVCCVKGCIEFFVQFVVFVCFFWLICGSDYCLVV